MKTEITLNALLTLTLTDNAYQPVIGPIGLDTFERNPSQESVRPFGSEAPDEALFAGLLSGGELKKLPALHGKVAPAVSPLTPIICYMSGKQRVIVQGHRRIRGMQDLNRAFEQAGLAAPFQGLPENAVRTVSKEEASAIFFDHGAEDGRKAPLQAERLALFIGMHERGEAFSRIRRTDTDLKLCRVVTGAPDLARAALAAYKAFPAHDIKVTGRTGIYQLAANALKQAKQYAIESRAKTLEEAGMPREAAEKQAKTLQKGDAPLPPETVETISQQIQDNQKNAGDVPHVKRLNLRDLAGCFRGFGPGWSDLADLLEKGEQPEDLATTVAGIVSAAYKAAQPQTGSAKATKAKTAKAK